jgi:translation initiation factor 2-alpha kinase 4
LSAVTKELTSSEKVKLRRQEDEQKVLREVENLSKVNHQYIVRYVHCWFEDAPRKPASPPSASIFQNDQDQPNGEDQHSDPFSINLDDLSSRRDTSTSFPRIRFVRPGEETDSDDDSEGSSSNGDQSSGGETAEPSQVILRPVAVPSKPVAIPGRPVRRESVSTETEYTGDDEDETGFTNESVVEKILYISMEFVERVRVLVCPCSPALWAD